MKDGRMSVYFNDEDREVMTDIINRYVQTDLRFRQSEAEFVRYCIRYTVENDKTFGKKSR